MREGTKSQTRTIREIEYPANLGEASESRVELSQKDNSLFFVTVNVEIITKVFTPHVPQRNKRKLWTQNQPPSPLTRMRTQTSVSVEATQMTWEDIEIPILKP